MDVLLQLRGEWVGIGEGTYPTIASFPYKEITRFTHDGERNQLHFEQRTMRANDDGNWIQSHWECGFLFWKGDHQVQLCTVHSGGRFEKLLGGLVTVSDGLQIDFESDFLGNDGRMVGSARIWTLKNDIFSYEMSMATHTTPSPKMQFHLRAELTRQSER